MLSQRHLPTLIRRFYQHDSRFREKLPEVKRSSARVSRVIKKRREDESLASQQDRKFQPRNFEPFPFLITEGNKAEVVQRLVTPLHDIPYEEQLSSKESYCRNALRLFGQKLYKSGTPVRLNVSRLPCHVNQMVRPPYTTGYRNSNEFSVWRGHDGKTKTVGFMAFPIKKHGDTVCMEPTSCLITNEETKRLVDILQDFIRNQAKLSVCYNLGQEGGWRRFMVRCNQEKEMMLVGIASPRLLRVQELIDERENFKEFMIQRCKEADLNLKSLYFQPCPHSKCKHQDIPYELLHGDKTITETINQFKFLISPDSFMHENTAGAELLFSTTRKTLTDCFELGSDQTDKPMIINPKCGVGVMAVHLADMSSKIFGIDDNPQAVDDATANARLNGIKNGEFINASFEIVLERILEKYSKRVRDIIIVCNPPKLGLHKETVDCLRINPKVKKIIYITPKIDAESVMKNLITLCSKRVGKVPPPFAPISATPVDVNPMVESFETIIVLERLPE